MTEEELRKLLDTVQRRGCEGQTLEIKAAHEGCPEKLYDSISAFANQDEGGTLLFGLDERQGFAKVGVYDAQGLQKKVKEQCDQMSPTVNPVFTVYDEDGKVFVSAEIAPIDLAERPCFKKTVGRMRGSFKRVGEADMPMTEYEVYSYDAFRTRFRDDLREAEHNSLQLLNQEMLGDYLNRWRRQRPNLALMSETQLYEMSNITRDGKVTLAAVLLFGLYPQCDYPQFCIAATSVPGTSMGQTDGSGNRFTNSKSIEGTLPEMLEEALAYIENNTKTTTRIDPKSGERTDVTEYPMDAVREIILNSLIHRDYSIHSEGKPISLTIYSDRLEVINSGGIYGRLSVDQLGTNAQPDARNPFLVRAMEILGKTENRGSGIPTIRRAMAERGLPPPDFENTLASFKVTLRHANTKTDTQPPDRNASGETDDKGLLAFCRSPRTRAEIIKYLGISSAQYALRRYLDPLIAAGVIRLTIPDKPRSHSQRYVTVNPHP